MDKMFPLDKSWVVGRALTLFRIMIVDLLATFAWFFEGWALQEYVIGFQNWVVKSQTSIVYDILGGGSAEASYVLDDIVGFTTLAGMLFIVVRAGMVIFQAYMLNLEGGETVPVLEYVKRIFFAIVFLVISPSLILNGFLIITLIATSASESTSMKISNFTLFTQNGLVNNTVGLATYCQQTSNVSETEAKAYNVEASKFRILGPYDDIGGKDGMISYLSKTVKNRDDDEKWTEDDVKSFVDDMHAVFCLGQGAIMDGDKKHGFSPANPDAHGYTVTNTVGGVKKTTLVNELPWTIYDSFHLDDATFAQTGIRSGRARGLEGFNKVAIEAGDVAGNSAGLVGGFLMSTILTIVGFVFYIRFAFGIAERTIDIFAAIWTSFMYAAAYVSSKNNQMIGNLIRKVMGIYLTHLFDMIFFSYWFRLIATEAYDPIIKILITVGFMRVMKKGNTAIKEYMDKTSEGTAIKGVKSIASSMIRSGGGGR